jgi:hypothetical protein
MLDMDVSLVGATALCVAAVAMLASSLRIRYVSVSYRLAFVAAAGLSIVGLGHTLVGIKHIVWQQRTAAMILITTSGVMFMLAAWFCARAGVELRRRGQS